jgi:predicted ATPase
MQTPDESVLSPEQLSSFDRAALFVARAQSARADFEITPHNAAHVAEICRKLDGIPLALELAAAQVADMSVVEVLDGLRPSLDALWSESPDVPEQHRTLRATLDRSYSLLNPSEQTTLQQLSVFAGGCFRDSAQAVCGAEGLLSLRTLYRHSLVSINELPDGRTRHFLLNVVREYARAKLAEQPDAMREVSLRHAEHFLTFAEQRVAQMRTRTEAQALDELSWEADNLRAAFAFVVSHAAQRSGVETTQQSDIQTALHSVACLTTN